MKKIEKFDWQDIPTEALGERPNLKPQRRAVVKKILEQHNLKPQRRSRKKRQYHHKKK